MNDRPAGTGGKQHCWVLEISLLIATTLNRQLIFSSDAVTKNETIKKIWRIWGNAEWSRTPQKQGEKKDNFDSDP